MKVRPDYVNPLTMMGQKKYGLTGDQAAFRGQRGEKADDVEELTNKKQTLQNQMLLMKSSSDGAAASADTQKAIEGQLEEITADLRTAETQMARSAAEAPAAPSAAIVKPEFDTYEKGVAEEESPGLYRLFRNEEGYAVSFAPYAENNARPGIL